MANGVGLRALEHAERLAVLCRKAADAFPAEERERLGDQLCRAADSVALNIAEGSAKRSRRRILPRPLILPDPAPSASYYSY